MNPMEMTEEIKKAIEEMMEAKMKEMNKKHLIITVITGIACIVLGMILGKWGAIGGAGLGTALLFLAA